ncbi:MAG: TRC40/GET3/ArsA family transport-energizing ATPase [Actinomycetota bacterium]|nr:TRC40/GET3/ArsA family transport-energizing ATPase [Actinomycetota bacterium]
MRVLLFTGKGGVGKTTTAAATALRLAAQGQRVVVTSADPAHSLADSFDVELDSVPRLVAPRCHAQQLDARVRLEENWSEIREWMLELFDWAGVAAIEAEELSVIPGLDELFALTEVQTLCESGEHDVVVVDCAPTAETIRLLSLPDLLSWYMERLFPASKRVSRMVGPVLSRLTSLPIADQAVFSAGERFYAQLDGVRAILSDPEVTSARLVVNPERMVIAEARRTYTYLSLFGYQVDAVVANRVLPERAGTTAGDDPWFDAWRAAQSEHMATIESGFAPLPVFRASHAGGEIVGVDALGAFADELWGEVDPSDRLVHGLPIRVDRGEGGYVLTMDLPFTERDEIDLTRSDDELHVTVGPHRRNLVLPDSLRRREIETAVLVDGRLAVAFVDA